MNRDQEREVLERRLHEAAERGDSPEYERLWLQLRDLPPLVRGGQGRTDECVHGDAWAMLAVLAVAVALLGAMALVGWAVTP